ncbi:MAG TPA: trypsin-like peptidase domain-containing protein [Pirellulaceae bacterium]|nr:trypsin-like peptidase domain-containing protein [Planctomycetales bacterium]MCB9938438.1 trypsin-like peptidase domain-containing protein [Planctomycetaceae bacterium]HRX77910.1 trypsin-like peptidase domain-containing protein [Pirellulaceae bacterium]
MTASRRFGYCCLLLGLVFVGTNRAKAAEPDAAQVAAALQELLVEAVAIGEKSVVAISRVRKDAQEPSIALRFPFGAARQSLDPTSPDFVPSDFGAGVIVDATGLVLTTLHVLGDVDTSTYYVWQQKRPFYATVIATAPWYDLAVLKIDGAGFHPIKFGDASMARKGQIVIALGNPAAIARDGNASASTGVISNIARRAPPTPSRSNEPLGRETLHHYGTLIQTDAKLDFGYSGGALLNLDGEMIGLTTSYAGSANAETAAGLAIPVDKDFLRIVDTLKSGQTPEFGFLGVGPETLNVSLRQQGMHGASLASVMAGTPAARAGLRTNDVVTHIDDHAIFNESDLFWRIGILAPGTTAQLRVVRGDVSDPNVAVIDLPVTVSKKYLNTVRKPIITADIPNWRGLVVDYATASPTFAQLVERPPADSLYVADVVQDSPSWQAGIRVGSFITHVGDLKVSTPIEFAELVQGITDEVTLHVTSNGTDTTPRTVSP